MIKKISLIISAILMASSIHMISTFYQCQDSLSTFLQQHNIQHKNNINSTFIVLTNEQRHSQFINLLRYNIRIHWYKIENNKIMAVLKPGNHTLLLQTPQTSSENNGSCNTIIIHPLKQDEFFGR